MYDQNNPYPTQEHEQPAGQTGFSGDGSYRWTGQQLRERGAQPQNPYSGYSGYQTFPYPQPEANSTPPPQKPKKEKNPKAPGRRGAGFVAATLVFALAGGAVGGGATAWYLDSTREEPAAVVAAPEPVSAPDPAPADGGTDTPAAPLPASTGGGDVSAVVEKAADSVVEIRLDTKMMTFFGEQDASSAGSGVIYSEDGYIITNNHVVEGGGTITVRTADGTEYEATLVGTDAKTDLAVIKIEARGLTPVTFADSDTVKVGQLAVAIGNPLGTLGGTVTNGVVSAKDREITIDNQSMTLMQTSAAVNPGNSGGGLFDGNGNLIGIVNAKSGGTDIEGLGFAIPSNTAAGVVKDLIEFGYVTGRPELGISVLLVNDQRAMNYYGVSGYGVYIMETTRNNGLRQGDRIIRINGSAVETPNDVSEAVLNSKVGDTLTFEIERDGQVTEQEVTVAEQLPESIKEQLPVPTGEI